MTLKDILSLPAKDSYKLMQKDSILLNKGHWIPVGDQALKF